MSEHSDSSQLFFFGVFFFFFSFFNFKSNPIPALADGSASYFGIEIVGSELAPLQVT